MGRTKTNAPSASGPENGSRDAVTIAVSKRRGQNATVVAREVMRRIDSVRPSLLNKETNVSVTRNYGETAKEKSDELLYHMALATLSVTLLIALFLGVREALVVLVAIPVTLALTLLVYSLLGYTLNRITLFALIFSIGILVDDAIVVVENIHRHFAMRDGRSLRQVAVDAVAEVGNPTILATWAVIAAILPMAFVSGLMGPYMRPIPVGASVAMMFSLGIAFVISPWAFTHVLALWKPKETTGHGEESFLDRLYRKVMGRLLTDTLSRWIYLGGTVAFYLLAACSLVYFKKVTMKMLPFDNKNEFEVVLTCRRARPFPKQNKRRRRSAKRFTVNSPEVERVTSYVGTAAPYNFNGLVRHYFCATAPIKRTWPLIWSDKKSRRLQSHAVASSLRPLVQAIADRYNARVQVAEIPPGPPVLSTLVFEVYGPDNAARDAFARKLQQFLRRKTGLWTWTPTSRQQNRWT
jgi:multidrug efflux pump subunit AcrB